jgi:hypothetical protein
MKNEKAIRPTKEVTNQQNNKKNQKRVIQKGSFH